LIRNLIDWDSERVFATDRLATIDSWLVIAERRYSFALSLTGEDVRLPKTRRVARNPTDLSVETDVSITSV